MDSARPLDIPCRRPVGAADRGHRAYFHRCRGGAAAVGTSAVALSPDLGAGVPVTPAVAAQVHADAATVGDHGGDPAVGDRRRAEPVADARRPPALLLHHCDGLSWRVGAHPPRREISHRFLCRAVVRRHGRRTVRGTDRAVHVLLGRGISDPGGAGGAVPAASRRTVAAMDPLVLAAASHRCGGADRAVLQQRQNLHMAGYQSESTW